MKSIRQKRQICSKCLVNPQIAPGNSLSLRVRDMSFKTDTGSNLEWSWPPVKSCQRLIVARAFERITQTPDVLAGRATIRGLRISVAHVINLVANGMTPAQIVEELPDLEEEDIREALVYAAALAQDELHPLRA